MSLMCSFCQITPDLFKIILLTFKLFLVSLQNASFPLCQPHPVLSPIPFRWPKGVVVDMILGPFPKRKVSSRVLSKCICNVLGFGSSMTLSRITWTLLSMWDLFMTTVSCQIMVNRRHRRSRPWHQHCFSVMHQLKEPVVNICLDSLPSFYYVITHNTFHCPHFYNKVSGSFLIVQLEHLSAWSSNLGLFCDATQPHDWYIPWSHEGYVIDVFSVLMGAVWLMDQSYVRCSSIQTTVAPPLAS